MKRLFLLFSVGAFFVSCETDKFYEGSAPSEEPAAGRIDPFTVPLDEALGKMYDLMDDIYGPATRSSSTRAIASVETLKGSDFGGIKTRSGAAMPENLAYIVNFCRQ